jgi:murein DD-endopeptidase MepM/ murein hydrolase activator NlpD
MSWIKNNSIIEEFKRHYTPRLNILSPWFHSNETFKLSHKLAFILFLVCITLIGVAIEAGYRLAHYELKANQPAMNEPAAIPVPLDPAIAQQMGRIEANLIRINALCEHLVTVGKLDPQEFNFTQEPPMGGPANIQEVESLLDKRFAQLTAVHYALLSKLGQHELSFTGAGKAVANGWISSFFGTRYDPFTGRRAWHSGVDIVAKEGSKIKALAGGIVSFAGEKGGYGRLVEIDHGQGIATRYGHSKALLVKEGELVRKGQAIALLGSSGRSTGPHLHLEVHKDGTAVDPGHYFPDLRKNS